jgi:sugar phosphate isomerase/epimerase
MVAGRAFRRRAQRGPSIMSTILTRQEKNAANRVSRRQALQAIGLGLLGTQVLAASADDARAEAKKNLRLGIFSKVYGHLPLEEAANRIKADGFRGVITDYDFADVRFNPLKPDWEAVKRITATLERHGIRIAAISGYYNPVDPDRARRRTGEARMEVFIANWKRLGCPNISTETGTLNAKSEWLESPENATEEGYRQCRAALEKLAGAAEKAGAMISIEPYWRNVIDSIDRAERIFRDIPSPALRLVMDPCNYFRKEDLPQMQTMLGDMFSRLGDKIVVAHAKDVMATADATDTPPPAAECSTTRSTSDCFPNSDARSIWSSNI